MIGNISFLSIRFPKVTHANKTTDSVNRLSVANWSSRKSFILCQQKPLIIGSCGIHCIPGEQLHTHCSLTGFNHFRCSVPVWQRWRKSGKDYVELSVLFPMSSCLNIKPLFQNMIARMIARHAHTNTNPKPIQSFPPTISKTSITLALPHYFSYTHTS